MSRRVQFLDTMTRHRQVYTGELCKAVTKHKIVKEISERLRFCADPGWPRLAGNRSRRSGEPSLRAARSPHLLRDASGGFGARDLAGSGSEDASLRLGRECTGLLQKHRTVNAAYRTKIQTARRRPASASAQARSSTAQTLLANKFPPNTAASGRGLEAGSRGGPGAGSGGRRGPEAELGSDWLSSSAERLLFETWRSQVNLFIVLHDHSTASCLALAIKVGLANLLQSSLGDASTNTSDRTEILSSGT